MAKSTPNSRRASRREMRRIMVPKSYCRRQRLLGKREARGESERREAGARSRASPSQDAVYRMRISIQTFLFLGLVTIIPHSARAQNKAPILAVFAHPDDERVIGPLLSKLAREGRETHLVIATDGSKGVRDFAKIPAGPELAAARTKEASCAAKRLGVRRLHIL